MNIKHNRKNAPDIFGYEMKKISKKITLGDFSASEYVFSKKRSFIDEYNNWNVKDKMTRNEFIEYFGNANEKKNGRYSWSGSCIPKYGIYNDCGQKLFVNKSNDICIFYRYKKDIREHKKEYNFLRHGKKLIAIWKKDKMKSKINNKFDIKGFFICKKENNVYTKICFGEPFNFKYFIENIKKGIIFFDSGMYYGNNRNYSQFRCRQSNFWNNLIYEEF